jgi:hypothetical protein
VDLFEKRGEEWRVLQRTVVYDWQRDLGPFSVDEDDWFGQRKPNGGKAPDDPIYQLLERLRG